MLLSRRRAEADGRARRPTARARRRCSRRSRRALPKLLAPGGALLVKLLDCPEAAGFVKRIARALRLGARAPPRGQPQGLERALPAREGTARVAQPATLVAFVHRRIQESARCSDTGEPEVPLVESLRVVARFSNGQNAQGHDAGLQAGEPALPPDPRRGRGVGRGAHGRRSRRCSSCASSRARRSRRKHRGFLAAPAETSQGRKIAVRFPDGELLCGYTLTWSAERKGFFVSPADSESNNVRVYVVTAAAAEVKVGPAAEQLAQKVLGAKPLRGARRPSSPVAASKARRPHLAAAYPVVGRGVTSWASRGLPRGRRRPSRR